MATPSHTSVPNSLSTTLSTNRLKTESNGDYRIAIFGAAGVGKSSLVLRYVRGTFKEAYNPTVEDTYRHTVTLSNQQICTLQIIDTTGSHQFPAMQRLNIQKSNAFLLIYSITSKQSLEEVKKIFLEMRDIKLSSNNTRVPMILVGSKCDESNMREVPTTQGERLAKEMNCLFMETSSKTNTNVKELFEELLKLEDLNCDTQQLKNDKKKKTSKKCILS